MVLAKYKTQHVTLLSMLCKTFSRQHILKYLLETICMKGQRLFSGENKNIVLFYSWKTSFLEITIQTAIVLVSGVKKG